MWDGGGWWPVRTKVQHKGLRGAHWHNILSMETYQVFVLESISRTMSKHLWQLNKICLPNGLQQTWFKQESFLFVTTFINSCLWVMQAKGVCFHQQHLSNRIKWGLKNLPLDSEFLICSTFSFRRCLWRHGDKWGHLCTSTNESEAKRESDKEILTGIWCMWS